MSYKTNTLNDAQLRLYRKLWGEVRRALRSKGLSPAAADARRKEIHAEVGAVDGAGAGVSSLDLTNAQFTRVKAAFMAIIEPENLDAQLAPENEDVVVLRWVARARARELLKKHDVEGYITGVGAQMGCAYTRVEYLEAGQLRKIIAALVAQLKRAKGPPLARSYKEMHELAAAAAGEPF